MELRKQVRQALNEFESELFRVSGKRIEMYLHTEESSSLTQNIKTVKVTYKNLSKTNPEHVILILTTAVTGLKPRSTDEELWERMYRHVLESINGYDLDLDTKNIYQE